MTKIKKEQVKEEAPKARGLLELALSTIARELNKIESVSKSDAQYPMAPEHMHSLKEYTKTLIAADKNEKDYPDDETDETDEMTFEELRAAAKVVIEEGKKK